MAIIMQHIYIVTPCYNAAATLGRTLESIIAQQGIVLRYHVQDAASTDGSQDVLLQSRNRCLLKQFAFITQFNKGSFKEKKIRKNPFE